MPRVRYNAEEIIHKLRDADVVLGRDKTLSQIYTLGWRHRPDPLP